MNDWTPPSARKQATFFKVPCYGPGERILDLIPRAGVVDLKELGLNKRQIEALRLMINERRELSNQDYRELFGVSNRTATTDLRDLVERDWARVEGKGPATRYAAG